MTQLRFLTFSTMNGGAEVITTPRTMAGGQVAPELATSSLGLLFPAGLFVSIRRVVEVRPNRGFCATEQTRDLGDREALLVAVLARERDRWTTLLDAVQSHHAPDDTADCRQAKERTGRRPSAAMPSQPSFRT
jgi:hypothetical protein